jgi:hypothetical protein
MSQWALILLWRLAAFIRVQFTMLGLKGVYRNMGVVTQYRMSSGIQEGADIKIGLKRQHYIMVRLPIYSRENFGFSGP